MKKILLILLATLFINCTAAFANSEKRNVLFLNSYQNGYAWSDRIIEGVRTVFDDSGLTIDLHIEYMDTKRFKDEPFFEKLHQYYSFKYKNYKFDAIIASDNNAFNFIKKYHKSFFPEVPVIFCGINDFKIDEIPKGLNYAAVLENPDIKSNVDLAMKFRPELSKVVVVGDNSVTSKAIMAQIHKVEPLFIGRIKFEYWNDLTLSELLLKSRRMGRDELLLFTPFYKGAHGELYSSEEVLNIIYKNSPVMIISIWEFLLGHGTVGGKLLSGEDQGKQAAYFAVHYLKKGKFPKDRVIKSTNEYFMFDYNVLKRFDIDEDQLPSDSIIINSPDYFYKLDKQVFWIIIVSILVLSMILVLLVMSILQRRKVEKRIIAQLSFQEILMDTIPLLICWKDTNHRYLGANRSFTNFFGLSSPSHIIGMIDQSLQIDRDFTLQVSDWDQQVMDTGEPLLRMSWKMVREDGEPVWLEINKVPLYNEKGQVVGSLTTAQDVTRRVNLEKQLLQSQKMEAIGTLAGGIAHDFNNILTSIMNSVELAITDIDRGSITYKDLNRAIKAANRGSRVVKQILTFSKPSQEGFKATDIAEVVRETVDFIKASLPRNISVCADLADEMPMIMADPTQIHQVIMNLCTNSFQALRGSGGKIDLSLATVKVGVEQAQFMRVEPGTYLKLDISDNGPGIPLEIIDKIFDPFFTTKGKAEGTGLGLAVVHGLIKGHGGGVSVVSVPNVKTSFEIFLPVKSVQPRQGSKKYGSLPRGAEKILFVEDDEDQIETTPRILDVLGYEVTATISPSLAYDMIFKEPNRFDLVISDFDMPETNGLELAEKILQIAPDIPVLIVSGRRNFAQDASGITNVKKIVMKPYSKQILAESIREVIDGAQ